MSVISKYVKYNMSIFRDFACMNVWMYVWINRNEKFCTNRNSGEKMLRVLHWDRRDIIIIIYIFYIFYIRGCKLLTIETLVVIFPIINSER